MFSICWQIYGLNFCNGKFEISQNWEIIMQCVKLKLKKNGMSSNWCCNTMYALLTAVTLELLTHFCISLTLARTASTVWTRSCVDFAFLSTKVLFWIRRRYWLNRLAATLNNTFVFQEDHDHKTSKHFLKIFDRFKIVTFVLIKLFCSI